MNLYLMKKAWEVIANVYIQLNLLNQYSQHERVQLSQSFFWKSSSSKGINYYFELLEKFGPIESAWGLLFVQKRFFLSLKTFVKCETSFRLWLSLVTQDILRQLNWEKNSFLTRLQVFLLCSHLQLSCLKIQKIVLCEKFLRFDILTCLCSFEC